jgi:hypothetical protein
MMLLTPSWKPIQLRPFAREAVVGLAHDHRQVLVDDELPELDGGAADGVVIATGELEA